MNQVAHRAGKIAAYQALTKNNRLNTIEDRANALYAALRELGGWRTASEIRKHVHKGPLTGTLILDYQAYSALMKLNADGAIKTKKISARTRKWKVI